MSAYPPGMSYRAYLDEKPMEEIDIRSFPTEPPPIPDWLRSPDPAPIKPGKEMKSVMLAQFEMVFPRVLEKMYSGFTLNKALNELPIEIDSGAFLRWLKKDPTRNELYREAKEIRTEAWAGKIIEHASGDHTHGDDCSELIQRSKLIVDTYKWLMAADNRRTYGDTKQIEMTSTISITAALTQAQNRVMIDAVDAELVDDVKMLTDGDENEN